MDYGIGFANVGVIASIAIAGTTVFVWILGLIARNIFTSVSFVLTSRRHMYLSQDDLCFDFSFPKGEGKEKEYTDITLLGGKGRKLYRIGVIAIRPISFSNALVVNEDEKGYRFKKSMGQEAEVTVRFRLLYNGPLQDFDGIYLMVKENRKKLIAKVGDIFRIEPQQLSFRRLYRGKRVASFETL